MATFEIWKTVSYEAVCFIEADSLEEAKQLLVDEAQDWDSINGQDEVFSFDGEEFDPYEEEEANNA
jgi:hypothetical protein